MSTYRQQHALAIDSEDREVWADKAAVLRALGRDLEAKEAEEHAYRFLSDFRNGVI
jgi:hypothetical protein